MVNGELPRSQAGAWERHSPLTIHNFLSFTFFCLFAVYLSGSNIYTNFRIPRNVCRISSLLRCLSPLRSSLANISSIWLSSSGPIINPACILQEKSRRRHLDPVAQNYVGCSGDRPLIILLVERQFLAIFQTFLQSYLPVHVRIRFFLQVNPEGLKLRLNDVIL